MYVTNIWGILFCFYIPTILITIISYYEGREEGKKYARINRVQHRKNNDRNSYAKRPNGTKYNRNR